MIKLSTPLFDRKEEKAILSVLRSGQLSSGKKVLEFEDRFARFLKIKYGAGTSSGTSALHLACLALGLKEGDEVITTPFSFVASSNAITFTGAKPVFVDIDSTFNLDPNLIEQKITPHTKAIMPVHLYGRPADMIAINKIAQKHHLKVIEDAAQAHGASINGRSVGTFSDIAAFSFYATKNISTGEGGMVVTNNKNLIEKVRLLRNHGSKVKYVHEILGYNFRMTEIQAALGLVQLKKLKVFNQKRYQNALYLNNHLQNLKYVELPTVSPSFSQHQYTIRVKKPVSRDTLKKQLEAAGIETGIFYPTPIHQQKLYQKSYPDLQLPEAEKAATEVLSLPIHPLLKGGEIDKIIRILKNYVS